MTGTAVLPKTVLMRILIGVATGTVLRICYFQQRGFRMTARATVLRMDTEQFKPSNQGMIKPSGLPRLRIVTTRALFSHGLTMDIVLRMAGNALGWRVVKFHGSVTVRAGQGRMRT